MFKYFTNKLQRVWPKIGLIKASFSFKYTVEQKFTSLTPRNMQ